MDDEKKSPAMAAGELEEKLSGQDNFTTVEEFRQSRLAQAEKFFGLLFGKVTGKVWGYLWTKPDRQTIPYFVSDSDERAKMARNAIELADSGLDVYVGVNCVGVKLPHNQRATETTVTVQTATITDIDILGGKHVNTATKKYPPTFDVAKSLLPFQLSMIVDSGYGLHGYCLYSEPVTITDDNRESAKARNEKFLEVIRSRADEFASVVDSVGDLPRILRVPGTYNFKRGAVDAKIVELVEVNDVRFTPDELSNTLEELLPTQDDSLLSEQDGREPAPAVDSQPKQDGQAKATTTKANSSTGDEKKDLPEYDLWRAERMLDIIDPAALSFNDWLAVISSCKNIGMPYNIVDAFNQRDTSRYNAEENFEHWNSKLNSDGIKPLHDIAKRFGYAEYDEWHEYHDREIDIWIKQVETGGDYSRLFDGFRPIKICAGSILNVVDADTKPALETLFVDRDFLNFVTTVAEMIDEPAQIDSSPFGNSEVSIGQVKNALQWLVVVLFRYFNEDTDELKKFIVGKLQAATATGAISFVDDEQFWEGAITQAKIQSSGKDFHFDAKFRSELIACARHSKEFLASLLRFDYPRLENFLRRDFTDIACAELLIDVQKNFLRFDTKQATWYTWRGNFWQAVNVQSLSSIFPLWTPLARKTRAFAEIERFRKYAERDEFAINNPDCTIKTKKVDGKGIKNVTAEKFGRLEKAAKAAHAKFVETGRLENSRSIVNFLTQASGLPSIQIETDDLDKDRFLFNCANVTINLKTMQTYKARQSDLITLSTKTEYNPAATSEVWTDFLSSAIPDENLRDWLQRFFGYCLCGDTAENLFVFIHGVGGSGKTTTLNAINGALGDYAKIFSVDTICENRKQKDGEEPSPALAALRGCRLARSSETKKNRRLDEATIKRWTGSDPLPARELHKPAFEFKPSFKIVVDGNFALRVTDINDDGLRRRLRIVPFDNPPAPDKVDTSLETKLSTPTARSAILNWLVEGWKNYQAKGLKDIPAVMQTALDKFYTANNVMADFLEAHDYQTGDKTDNKYRVQVMDAWKCYQKWQRETPTASMLTRADFVDAFTRATQKDGVEVKLFDNTQYFIGCRLNTTAAYDFFAPPE